ncbi:TIGR03086 family metal-binding protein [Marinactinospora thermotolerans]|uniref:TIGR03086 family protein n=1 Tax=Marinactinospora thermotolerans DSM 45154 TaxID=1122192 RepID=A0A1T4LXB5_9ACTN|nr:TIGR03086 family metal-binding protein [Marinactinospora thermotolerans]SJZ59307.1 TIGR03086 family protein [Marinactinospora thermotolerans DSM 45154]
MSEISARYERLATEFAATVARVPAERWDAASPCAGWTALDVVRHVVDTQGAFLGLIGREAAPLPSVEEDPLAAWKGAAHGVQTVLDDPRQAATTFEGHFGVTAFEEAVDRFIAFDLVVHRWDLARATGLDERIAPADLRWIGEAAAGFATEPSAKEHFAPGLTPPPGADEQTRVLALLGRRAW